MAPRKSTIAQPAADSEAGPSGAGAGARAGEAGEAAEAPAVEPNDRHAGEPNDHPAPGAAGAEGSTSEEEQPRPAKRKRGLGRIPKLPRQPVVPVPQQPVLQPQVQQPQAQQPQVQQQGLDARWQNAYIAANAQMENALMDARRAEEEANQQRRERERLQRELEEVRQLQGQPQLAGGQGQNFPRYERLNLNNSSSFNKNYSSGFGGFQMGPMGPGNLGQPQQQK